MSWPETIIALFFLQLVAGPLQAQDSSPAPLPLKVRIQMEGGGLTEASYRACVTAGTNKFAFFLPDGFRVNNDPVEGRIKLVNREGNCGITVAILGAAPETMKLDPEFYRALLLERNSQAKVTEEFERGVNGQVGSVFDLQWKNDAGMALCSRTLFVASRMGVFEFTAVSAPAHRSARENGFNRVIGSFTVSRNGQFEVLHPGQVN
jgi:hypothetical protein